ncbi:hypothetical protein LXL04_024439 [Taraxacum kok-saghyz]
MWFFGIQCDSPNIIEYCHGFSRNRPKWVNIDEPYQRFSRIQYDFFKSGRPYSGLEDAYRKKKSVEVIGNEDGMDRSYFTGKVSDRSRGRRTIMYDTLIADDGSPLEEVINIRLRPPPPTVLARYHLGDMVEAWHNEDWWVGRYVRKEGENYNVFFENEAPENQHVPYPKAKIRVHQEWKALETGGKWKYVKR